MNRREIYKCLSHTVRFLKFDFIFIKSILTFYSYYDIIISVKTIRKCVEMKEEIFHDNESSANERMV